MPGNGPAQEPGPPLARCWGDIRAQWLIAARLMLPCFYAGFSYGMVEMTQARRMNNDRHSRRSGVSVHQEAHWDNRFRLKRRIDENNLQDVAVRLLILEAIELFGG